MPVKHVQVHGYLKKWCVHIAAQRVTYSGTVPSDLPTSFRELDEVGHPQAVNTALATLVKIIKTTVKTRNSLSVYWSNNIKSRLVTTVIRTFFYVQYKPTPQPTGENKNGPEKPKAIFWASFVCLTRERKKVLVRCGVNRGLEKSAFHCLGSPNKRLSHNSDTTSAFDNLKAIFFSPSAVTARSKCCQW